MRMIFNFVLKICSKCWSGFAIIVRIVLQVVHGYRHFQNINLIFHKATQEKVEKGQIWRSQRPESGPPQPIHCSGNCLLKNVVISVWMCGGTLSYWKTMSGLFWSRQDINHNSNMSQLISCHLTSVLHSSDKCWNYSSCMCARKLFEFLFTVVGV
jgi:hypothetical protein